MPNRDGTGPQGQGAAAGKGPGRAKGGKSGRGAGKQKGRGGGQCRAKDADNSPRGRNRSDEKPPVT